MDGSRLRAFFTDAKGDSNILTLGICVRNIIGSVGAIKYGGALAAIVGEVVDFLNSVVVGTPAGVNELLSRTTIDDVVLGDVESSTVGCTLLLNKEIAASVGGGVKEGGL